jgi:hypothetical protein
MVGHASVLIETPEAGLLCDPWFGGRIFNDSWDLTSPSTPPEALAGRMTHLWVSHEHPDHLHWPSLKRLAALVGNKAVLAFQQHWTTDVVTHLHRVGFGPVEELAPLRWTILAPSLSVASIPCGPIDCGLAVRAGGSLILNLNDCKIGARYLKALSKRFPEPDLLCCQFSPASWQPTSAVPGSAAEKLYARAARYAAAFRPRRVLLFASHSYYCHRENARMNDYVASPAEAVERVRAMSGREVAVLYPGDRWEPDTGFHAEGDSLERYRADFAEARRRPPVESPPADEHRLLEAAQARLRLVEKAYPRLARRNTPPLRLHLHDLGRRLTLDIASCTASLDSGGECDLAAGSQAVEYACVERWGFDTFDISARYEVLRGTKDHPALQFLYGLSAGLHFGRRWKEYMSLRAARYFWARRWDLLDRWSKKRRERGEFVRALEGAG